MKDRSTILITPRLVDLEGFEEILVLRVGQVVERGDRSQLLQEQGLFNRLWQLQATCKKHPKIRGAFCIFTQLLRDNKFLAWMNQVWIGNFIPVSIVDAMPLVAVTI